MSDDLRDMTGAEERWWNILKAHLRKQPKGIELHARVGGAVGIAPAGTRLAINKRDGDSDRLGEAEWDSVVVPRLDGRDSQL